MCNLQAFMLGLFFIYTNLAWTSSYKIVSRTISIKTKTAASIIDIRYPQGFSNKQINLKIKAVIDKLTKPYVDAAPQEDDSNKNMIYIDFEIKSNNSHVLSILFYIETYLSGGAHSSRWIKTLNFIDGENVKLEQLFKPNSNYLSIISQYCYTNILKKISNDDVLKEGASFGTEPKKINFTNWYFNKKGLVIVFEAPHLLQGTYGPLTYVKIPYTTLKKWPYTKKEKIIELSTLASLAPSGKVEIKEILPL